MKPTQLMTVKKVKLNQIKLSENSRIEIKDLSDLMTSIKQDGLLQPVGVRKSGKAYKLVYGNRRHAAIKKLGWKDIDAVILPDVKKNKKDLELSHLLMNLAENVVREDLTAFEEGRIYFELIEQYGLSPREVASRIGCAKTRVLSSVSVYKGLPSEFVGHTKHRNKGHKKVAGENFISASNAATLVNMKKTHGLSRPDLRRALTAVQSGGLVTRKIATFGELIKKGKTTKQALNKLVRYKNHHVDFMLDERAVKRFESKEGKSVSKAIHFYIKKSSKFRDLFGNS